MRRRFMSQSDDLQPMYFEAVEDGLTISLPSYDIEYRIGIDGEWQTLSAGESTPSINFGTKIFFKKESKGNLGTFLTNVSFRLGGDCRSLLHGEKVTKDSPLYENCFNSLFYNSLLVKVEDDILPATTLASDCYHQMFEGCKSLVNTPALPATTLDINCYYRMFYGCISLTAAPALPATELANGCYYSMFEGCYLLVHAPELPAENLADYCYQYMFNGCFGLTKASALPATTLAKGCYYGMYQYCRSLTSAPKLPATTLANNCYFFMFRYCTNLNYIKMLATDIPAANCLYNWVDGVASTGTFVKNKDATWDVVGDSGVPTGWMVITE